MNPVLRQPSDRQSLTKIEMEKHMEQIRPLASLSHDELVARIEQDVEVIRLRDAEIVEQAAAIEALRTERDALREALKTMVEMVEMNGFGKDYAIDMARAALAQEQGGDDAP